MYITAFNPGDQPVALGDGSTVGGGEWAPVLTTAGGVRELLDSGRLLEVKDPGEDQEGVAQDAFVRTRRYAERSDTTKDMDKAALMKVAVKALLVEEDSDINRAELEDLVVRSDADLPKSRAKSTTQNKD